MHDILWQKKHAIIVKLCSFDSALLMQKGITEFLPNDYFFVCYVTFEPCVVHFYSMFGICILCWRAHFGVMMCQGRTFSSKAGTFACLSAWAEAQKP